MICRWNDLSMKHLSMKRPVDEMTCRWNDQSMKRPVDEMTCRWNDLSMKWPVDETTLSMKWPKSMISTCRRNDPVEEKYHIRNSVYQINLWLKKELSHSIHDTSPIYEMEQTLFSFLPLSSLKNATILLQTRLQNPIALRGLEKQSETKSLSSSDRNPCRLVMEQSDKITTVKAGLAFQPQIPLITVKLLAR